MVNILTEVKDEATVPKNAPVTLPIDPIKMEEIQIDRLKWANRRKFAWVSLYAIILLTFLFVIIALLYPAGFDKIVYGTDLLTWLVGFISVPLITYGGGTISQTVSQTVSQAMTKGK